MDGIKNPYNFRKKRSDWFDWWMADESPAPVAREEIRRARVARANTYNRRTPPPRPLVKPAEVKSADGKSLVINLTMPNIKVDTGKNQINLKINDPRALVITACSLIIISVVLTRVFTHHSSSIVTSPEITTAAKTMPTVSNVSGAQTVKAQAPQAADASTAKASTAKAATTGSKPKFTPVVPVIKPELANSPFARSAYDDSRGVYTVMDTFKGAPVTINEQTLPSSDTNANQQAVKQNADQIKASQIVTLRNNFTAYVATNSQNHNQTAVFAVKNVLIYINSITTHSSDDWRDYLNLFQ
jgi:hypothetical protein